MNFVYLKFLLLLTFPLLVLATEDNCNCDDIDGWVSRLKAQNKLDVALKKIEDQQECGEDYYVDCKHALEQGNTESGIYRVGPFEGTKQTYVRVYCDMTTDGGGWLVFQRRQNSNVDFYRNWYNYTNGFGCPSGDFWLGNKYLHSLTKLNNQELRVDMKKGGASYYSKYSGFSVGSEASKFVLSVSGYSGTAGDALTYQNGQKFTTKDQDNDPFYTNCAKLYKGAWWYKLCHESNLNGLYLNGSHKSFADGINWKSLAGYHYSLQFTEMKIRPK